MSLLGLIVRGPPSVPVHPFEWPIGRRSTPNCDSRIREANRVSGVDGV